MDVEASVSPGVVEAVIEVVDAVIEDVDSGVGVAGLSSVLKPSKRAISFGVKNLHRHNLKFMKQSLNMNEKLFSKSTD